MDCKPDTPAIGVPWIPKKKGCVVCVKGCDDKLMVQANNT